MASNEKREVVEKALSQGNGILRLKPAWVARDFLPPGRRLGLKEEEYAMGERGFVCERWLAGYPNSSSASYPNHFRLCDRQRIG